MGWLAFWRSRKTWFCWYVFCSIDECIISPCCGWTETFVVVVVVVDDELDVLWLPILAWLWYISGVGGVVLMYQPHWGLSTPPPPPLLVVGADEEPGSVGGAPYGLVGIIKPCSWFILGMYRLAGSWLSPNSSDLTERDRFIADLTGFGAVVDVTEWYGLGSWRILCEFPIVFFKTNQPRQKWNQKKRKDNKICKW